MSIAERGESFEAGRLAFTLYQWITAPDFYEDGEVRRAEVALSRSSIYGTPLLDAAQGLHSWLDAGGDRETHSSRTLIRYWMKLRLCKSPLPLPGQPRSRPKSTGNLARDLRHSCMRSREKPTIGWIS